MTTESTHLTPRGGSVLLGAAGAALAVGALMALVAWLVSDLAAVRSVAASVVLVVVVIGFGVLVLHVVASVMPGATVLVALVTYALQLVVMGAVVLALVRSGMLAHTLDRRWFGGGVAVATLAWTAAQIVASVRARIPVYDLPEAGA